MILTRKSTGLLETQYVKRVYRQTFRKQNVAIKTALILSIKDEATLIKESELRQIYDFAWAR